MKTVIGIDIGGSTTKIVGFDEEHHLIEPMFIKATDPVTSVYGAFGKFTTVNNIGLSDIERIMVTGVGSSFLDRPIFDRPCIHVQEFACSGRGGLYLSGLDKALIVSMGTGTACVYAERGKESEYLGGTGVGGGTLNGMAKRFLHLDRVEHLAEIARDGDLSNIDLRVGDITQKSIGGVNDNLTAANFGKLSDLASDADVALGMINLVFETICMVSVFAARTKGIRNIVLTGNMTNIPQCHTIFGKLNHMFDANFIIPKRSQFGTVIGAALADPE